MTDHNYTEEHREAARGLLVDMKTSLEVFAALWPQGVGPGTQLGLPIMLRWVMKHLVVLGWTRKDIEVYWDLATDLVERTRAAVEAKKGGA